MSRSLWIKFLLGPEGPFIPNALIEAFILLENLHICYQILTFDEQLKLNFVLELFNEPSLSLYKNSFTD